MFKNYNKTILSFLCLILLLFPILVFSENNPDNYEEITNSKNLQDSFGKGSMVENIAGESGFRIDIEDDAFISSFVGTLINAVLSILGVIFIILTIISGIRWMTAAGNEEQVKKSKSAIKQSLIGLFIVVASWGFWAIILRIINQF